MLHYEQLEFDVIKNLKRNFEEIVTIKAYDFNDNLIKLNDYVVCINEIVCNGHIEGFVTAIDENEQLGVYIEVSSLSGKVLDSYLEPKFFKVVAQT